MEDDTRSFGKRLTHAWNAFSGRRVEPRIGAMGYTTATAQRPGRSRGYVTSDKSIITGIYNKMAIDVALVDIKHIRKDTNGYFKEEIDSGLHECLMVRANADQEGFIFRKNIVDALFEHGVIAIVPIDTTLNPLETGGYDIKSMRVAKILEWGVHEIKVSVYNERNKKTEEIMIPKSIAAIVENPFYSVMNEPNSVLKRLIRKINLMDSLDEITSSGRLDILIKLPYGTSNAARRQQAKQRREELDAQLKDSIYGIGYLDHNEDVVQINRPTENNLLKQIEQLTLSLYGNLGLTENVFNGTADEVEMLNYYNRTVTPILTAITEAMSNKFLTKTARAQGQTIEFLRDPFKLVPLNAIAEMADKFTRNEILTGNEVRGIIGIKPSSDPGADELRNKNISAPSDHVPATEKIIDSKDNQNET